MIDDIRAVFWKEWKEYFQQRGMRGSVFNWLVMVVLMGVVIPLQMGRDWLLLPLLVLVWSWIAILAVMSLAADAFAGERERHTLETLLASRLPDRSILIGKILAITTYGMSIQTAGLLVAAVTVNVTDWQGSFQFYPPVLFVLMLLVSLLMVMTVAAVGVLVSLHSGTMRQAYQKMSVVFIILALLPTFGSQLLPAQLRYTLMNSIASVPSYGTLIAILAVLVVLFAAALAVGMAQFQRAKMVLD